MAVVVEEIMNRELFSARPTESARDALGYIRLLGISTSPVVDEDGALLGMISLRDLLGDTEGVTVADRMSAPVATVPARAPIERAAELMGEAGFHRLVVVDEQARPVGIVSSLDVVRGLIGMPARHPPVFPHLDAATGVAWTDDTVLELDRVEIAPDGPGVLVLVHGGAGLREKVVWAESCNNVRSRLIDMLSTPQDHVPIVAHWLERGGMRFRAASLDDRESRERVASQMRERAQP